MENSNSKEALNLYAEVEDLLGIKEYAPKLYGYFFNILDNLEFKSLIDIGCGGGDFLLDIKSRYKIDTIYGIDRSSKMVEVAKSKGLNSIFNKELKEIDNIFDIATATFDMVNYLTPQEFIEFFKDLKDIVRDGGYFIFDVNSEFGLSEVAVGNFIAEDSSRFLAIESFYEVGLYDSKFTLFKKDGNSYNKFSEYISQYYYSKDFFKLLGGWEVIESFPINLYNMDSNDKVIYVLKRV